MGSQKLGLGRDSSFDSEADLQRARDDQIADFQSRLFRSRVGWLIVPFGLAALSFILLDWAGYRGNVRPWDPKPLVEVWWHFPFWFVLVTVVFRFIVFLDKRY